jgi:hypothetical protein
MIPNLFILDSGGEVIIEKHFMPGFKRSVCDVFWEEAAKFDVKENVCTNTPSSSASMPANSHHSIRANLNFLPRRSRP